MPIPDKIPLWLTIYAWVGMLLFLASRFIPAWVGERKMARHFAEFVILSLLWPVFITLLLVMWFEVKKKRAKPQ